MDRLKRLLGIKDLEETLGIKTPIQKIESLMGIKPEDTDNAEAIQKIAKLGGYKKEELIDLDEGIEEPITATLRLGDIRLSKKAIDQAFKDIKGTKGSQTPERVDVFFDTRKNCYIVADGYHRIAEMILAGSGEFSPVDVRLIGSGYSDYYYTPEGDDILRIK